MENSKFYPILQDMVTEAVHFTTFYDILDLGIKKSWEQTESENFLDNLAGALQQLCEHLINIGDENDKLLQQILPDQLLENKETLIFHYQWIDAAKSFIVLWRNILFENQKAAILLLDQKITDQGIAQLRSDSHTSIIEAAQSLKAAFETINQDISSSPKKLIETVEKWYRQDNPWPVYRKQFLLLDQQSQDLQKQSFHLVSTHEIIENIKALADNSVQNCISEIETHKEIAKDSILFIGKHLQEQSNKIPIYIENEESKILTDKHNRNFSPTLEKNINLLSAQSSIVIASRATILQTKTINFNHDIPQWLDAEVVPLLMEIWELTVNVRNNLKMALINIRNRAILLHTANLDQQASIIGQDEICQPLNNFITQSVDIEAELNDLYQLINQRTKDHFQLSGLFSDKDVFLSLLNQSALTQLRSNQNELVDNIIDWGKRQKKRAEHWLSSVQEEDALSTSEKIVRYLQNRVPRANNQSYSGIFLTKGYIGESFWVGREQELKRIGTIIRQWEKGYRGTVLLTAERFAGKSLFGDLVSNRYFAQSTVRLSPNSTISLQGRSFSTTYDLGEALNFVSKYAVHSKVLIWLDDLELWHDPSQPISQNIEQLLQHIDHHFANIFYLISLSGHLKASLDKSHHISRSFQAEIKLNTMSQESIHEAILIRHGATHKQLVNEEQVDISPAQFKQMTSRINRASLGNIGEALHLWSCSIRSNGNDQVVFHSPSDYVLPNFLEADSALVLRVLFLEKRSTEYRLRKRFGPAFNHKYADALLRLQSVGLVSRQLDGWLEINELATNDILKLLEQNDYL